MTWPTAPRPAVFQNRRKRPGRICLSDPVWSVTCGLASGMPQKRDNQRDACSPERNIPMAAVPVIDISAFRSGSDTERAAVVSAVDRAATEVGFMQITGHGIPDSVQHGLTEAMDALFALP